jgi:uncharacterized protein YjiS (DUF1127 family)
VWENLTLKKHPSQNVNPVVRLHNTRKGGAARAALPDDRGIADRNLTRPAWGDRPDLNSRPAAVPTVAAADRPKPALWWSAFAFFMEGFALYGASLHPTAAFPVEAILTTARAPRPRPVSRGPAAKEHEHGTYAPSRNSNVVQFDRAPAPDARRSRRWHCLTSLGETIATLQTHWRREQEIKKAVAALAEFDDRTLRDMGIPSRSQIEQVVRYCHDC